MALSFIALLVLSLFIAIALSSIQERFGFKIAMACFVAAQIPLTYIGIHFIEHTLSK